MRRQGKLFYKPRVKEIMLNDYNHLDVARLALGLVKPGSKVLSIGCGAGREIKYLVSLSCNVIAVDLNKEFIEESKKIEPKAIYLNKKIEDLKFESNEFDYIVCLWNTINAIEKRRNRRKVIKKCEIWLKRKGILIITSKTWLKGFLPINDYTIASFEAGYSKYFWFKNTEFDVNKINCDGVWIILAQKMKKN